MNRGVTGVGVIRDSVVDHPLACARFLDLRVAEKRRKRGRERKREKS